MTQNYREQDQGLSSSEDKSTSSSSEEPEAVLGILFSPTSNYNVMSLLGEGVYGRVTKCVKVATGETVAVKIMKDKVSIGVMQETAMLKHLRAFDADRFNFIRCNDAFVDREYTCFEFEMLDISLREVIQMKPAYSFSVKEIRPILHQVATTLQFLKRQKIAHTDIKPENIMTVDHENQPLKIKVIDFGLARILPSGLDDYLQPLAYRAPEVMLGAPFTTAIDMWSLGCMAMELFLGYRLYSGYTEYEMLQHIVQTQGLPPRHLLDDGQDTKWFFKLTEHRHHTQWTLKTPFEFGLDVNTKIEVQFSSLDELKKVRPICHLSDEDTLAEIEDQEKFVELLKKILHLDLDKRITPSQLLQDPFITMNELADSYPYSFYVKSCSEMMAVCKDQSQSSDNWDQQNPQASTSTASLHQVPPAWHNHQEHPLILGITLSIAKSLRLNEDRGPPQGFSFSVRKRRRQTESIPMEVQLSGTSDEAQSSTGRPVKKRSRVEASQSGKRIPDRALSGRKRRRTNSEDDQTLKGLRQISKEAPTSSTATVRPWRKRTWETFTASPSGLGVPFSSSPERKKKKKMSLPCESEKAPTETSSTAPVRLRRKRTWETFTASPSGLRVPFSSSPERKKMCLPRESEEAPTSSTATVRPRKMEKWETFIASPSGLRGPNGSTVRPRKREKWETFIASPERKKMKMSLPRDSEEAPTSSTATVRPRKREKWETFIASPSGLRVPVSSSPERKKMKMSLPRESEEAPTETETSSSATVRPRRKRKRDAFIAPPSGLGDPFSSSPARKKMKMSLPRESEEAPAETSSTATVRPRRKRKREAFIAPPSGLGDPFSSSPARKKMKMSLPHEPEEAPTSLAEVKPQNRERKRSLEEVETEIVHKSDQASSIKDNMGEDRGPNWSSHRG